MQFKPVLFNQSTQFHIVHRFAIVFLGVNRLQGFQDFSMVFGFQRSLEIWWLWRFDGFGYFTDFWCQELTRPQDMNSLLGFGMTSGAESGQSISLMFNFRIKFLQNGDFYKPIKQCQKLPLFFFISIYAHFYLALFGNDKLDTVSLTVCCPYKLWTLFFWIII